MPFSGKKWREIPIYIRVYGTRKEQMEQIRADGIFVLNISAGKLKKNLA